MKIAFILDISESMGYGDPPKIDQAFKIISSVLNELESNDRVAIITFEVVSEEVLPFSPVKEIDIEEIKKNIDVRGTTCLSIGLKDGLSKIGEGDILFLLTDARPNLSLDRSGGFEGSIKLEEEAVNLISSYGKKINFYGIAIGEDAFIYILKRMASVTNGIYAMAENFKGLREEPKKDIEKIVHILSVSSIPAELPAAQPTWTKESQVLHVAVVSEEFYEKYKDTRKAIVMNPINGREARVALLPISDESLRNYRKRKPKIAESVTRRQRILLDKTYRDYLQITKKEDKVKLIILE